MPTYIILPHDHCSICLHTGPVCNKLNYSIEYTVILNIIISTILFFPNFTYYSTTIIVIINTFFYLAHSTLPTANKSISHYLMLSVIQSSQCLLCSVISYHTYYNLTTMSTSSFIYPIIIFHIYYLMHLPMLHIRPIDHNVHFCNNLFTYIFNYLFIYIISFPCQELPASQTDFFCNLSFLLYAALATEQALTHTHTMALQLSMCPVSSPRIFLFKLTIPHTLHYNTTPQINRNHPLFSGTNTLI